MKVHKVVIQHLQHADKINKLSHLLVLISFLATFVVSRIITMLQMADLFPTPNKIGDLHVHHLVPGIILLLISGYVAISFWTNRKLHLLMSVLFGAGAALTLDEFSLWLFLEDVYWKEEGRHSIDAIIIAAVILLITLVVGQVHFSKAKRSRR